MSTYLFAWNEQKWPWTGLAAEVERVRKGRARGERWSCARRRDLPAGSPFFLIRLGKKPTGIMGHGQVLSAPYPDKHWDGSGRMTNYVDIRFDDLREEPLIGWAELQESPFRRFRWGIQSSGIRIPDELASGLHDVWERRSGTAVAHLAEELPATERFVEGAKKTVVVNAYERDRVARMRCIEHYGFRCAVCGVLLEERYGPIATGLIHVHHLVELSSVRASYEVDPIKDLRPVCPNCHAVLHCTSPPMSIEKARALLGKQRTR